MPSRFTVGYGGLDVGDAVEISGFVAPGFEPVRAQFERNFTHHREAGASVCVYRGDECVVDLWGGVMDPQTEAPWQADSIINTFSVTKGLVALAVLQLEDQGRLDLDAPVTEVWPDFGRAGKQSITLRHILNHRSGVAALDQPLSLEDCLTWQNIDDAIVAQAPLWEPDTDQGYHGVTWGFLVPSIVARAAGTRIEDVFNPMATALDAEAYLGVPTEKLSQCATLLYRSPLYALLNVMKRVTEGGINGPFFRNVVFRPSGDAARAFSNPASLGARGYGNYNLDEVRQAVLRTTASARDRIACTHPWPPMVRLGVRVFSPGAPSAQACQSWTERDRIARLSASLRDFAGRAGVFTPTEDFLGHPGTGGCLGYADPKTGVSFGYVMNRMRSHVRSPTAMALSQAVYASMERG